MVWRRQVSNPRGTGKEPVGPDIMMVRRSQVRRHTLKPGFQGRHQQAFAKAPGSGQKHIRDLQIRITGIAVRCPGQQLGEGGGLVHVQTTRPANADIVRLVGMQSRQWGGEKAGHNGFLIPRGRTLLACIVAEDKIRVLKPGCSGGIRVRSCAGPSGRPGMVCRPRLFAPYTPCLERQAHAGCPAYLSFPTRIACTRHRIRKGKCAACAARTAVTGCRPVVPPGQIAPGIDGTAEKGQVTSAMEPWTAKRRELP